MQTKDQLTFMSAAERKSYCISSTCVAAVEAISWPFIANSDIHRFLNQLHTLGGQEKDDNLCKLGTMSKKKDSGGPKSHMVKVIFLPMLRLLNLSTYFADINYF